MTSKDVRYEVLYCFHCKERTRHVIGKFSCCEKCGRVS